MTLNDFVRSLPISRELVQSAALAFLPAPRRRIGGPAAMLGLGIALGAGLALLFAPKSGRQMRRQIGQQFDGAIRETEEMVDRKMREAASGTA